MLGETALFRQQAHLSDAIALETVHVCSFSLRQFEGLVEKHPHIALSIIANLGEKLHSTLQQLGKNTSYSVENRLLAKEGKYYVLTDQCLHKHFR